jgi:tetratricopeptide (TPR) repeat protein
MDRHVNINLILIPVLAAVLSFASGVCIAAVHAEADTGLMTRIISISERSIDGADVLIIQGDGRFPEHTAWIYTTPPKIVIDIPHQVPPFESIVRQVSSPVVERIRVGYHPEGIRLVLDVGGPNIPMFSTEVQGNTLVLTLNAGGVHTGEGAPSAHADKPEGKEKESPGISQGSDELYDAEAQLLRKEGIDARRGISKYVNGIDAYVSGNWSAAVKNLTRFIEKYPEDTYAEKAYFVVAKAYDRLHAEKAGKHFNEIKRRYEDAIYQHPQSAYVPDAYFSIADLCFRSEMVAEAMGYCNLVIKMEKHAHATLRAMILKAKLLSMSGKHGVALAIYHNIQQQYPGVAEGVRAKIETARTLFEMNRFHQSLDILTKLAETPEYLYQYPEMSRYLGYNYYQLSNFDAARKHLFRYYNTSPDRQDSHLVLAKIADTYREDGRVEAATKFYGLVLERYPDTEGAMISMYRMAEQQERGEVVPMRGGVPEFKVIGSHIGMPREIYEEVVQNSLETGEVSPLTQYALLKLSILDRKEQQYGSSMNRLKHLLKRYPHTKLKKEVNQAFEEALLCVLEEDFQEKKYKRIVNTYEVEKKVIANFTSPGIFMIIARSARHLGLDGLAVEMFKRADYYMPDAEKPADLLMCLAGVLFEEGKPDAALAYADLLIENHPEDKYAADGYVLKGSILSSLEKFEQAASMFSSALDRIHGSCDQPAIMILKAEALFESGAAEAAYQTLLAADKTIKGCDRPDADTLEEIGRVYLQSGYAEEALAVLQSALEMDNQGQNRSRLQLMMARCYEKLNNNDAYLAIYKEVANGEDPFWGKIAEEKMNEINFNVLLQKGKQNK